MNNTITYNLYSEGVKAEVTVKNGEIVYVSLLYSKEEVMNVDDETIKPLIKMLEKWLGVLV